jgi:hypothetical protein
MSIAEHLFRIAKEMAEAPDAPPEARSRFGRYQAFDGKFHFCPLCWIRHETRMPLAPVAGALQCTSCGARFQGYA